MLIRGEWDMEEAKQVWQEEAREDGIDIGISKERTEILALIQKGYTAADIENHLRKQTRFATA